MKSLESSLLCLLSFTVATMGDFWEDRADLIQLDHSESIGSNIVLNVKEEKVNNILMNFKYKELDDGFLNPGEFLPAQHFFKAKAGIEQSDIFKFIQKLPKGASLHSHDIGMVSYDYLFNLTFESNLYGCVVDERLKLKFFGSQQDDACNWKLLNESRKDNADFDNFVKSQLTLIVEDPVKTYPNLNVVWHAISDLFTTVTDLIAYKPIFQDYFYEVLRELHDDNILYVEFRGILPQVYELNGTTYSPVEIVGLYVETLKEFMEDYPKFYGAKFIYAPSRNVGNKTIEEYVQILRELQKSYPDFIAGFDLVGQEDLGRPLIDFVPHLLEIQNETTFFFHAAETNWNGESTDMNLFDAVLLGATRIGHGYGILKHPQIKKIIKSKEIAIEVNPISNQVLKLVDDIRNHPGSIFIAEGYPVIISCDDPSFWGTKALSYDWYMAFVGMANRDDDLRLLKQLAFNSLKYSALSDDKKVEALFLWENEWNTFIDSIILDSFNPYIIHQTK